MGSTKSPLVPPPHGGTPALRLQGQPAPLQPGEFKSGSSPAVVSFGFDKVEPPSAVYIQRDDVVTVVANSQIAGETITLNLRLLLPYAKATGQPDTQPASGVAGGPIVGPGYIQTVSITLSIPTALIQASRLITLTEGYLLSVAAFCSQATVTGQTYVRVMLNRGTFQVLPGNPYTTLLGGYVTLLAPVAWPTGPFIRTVDGPGFLAAYAVGNPGAGLDFNFTTAAAGRARLAGVVATLTTSAAAGNRFPSFQLFESTPNTLQYQVQDTAAVPASTVVTYSLAPGGTNVRGAGAPIIVTLPVPSPFMARAALNVRSSTQGLVAGDQWSAINVYTEEWLDVF